LSNDRPRLPTATSSAGSSGAKPYRRRLSNYLLNKSLQLRYVGFVTVLSALICGVLGYLIWQQENLASAQVLEAVDDTLCDMLDTAQCHELKTALDDDLTRHDNRLVLQMAAVGVGLVMVLFLYLVVMTHKVAGPLYKVSLYFEKMAQGRMGPSYPLRKGDMMQDFYDKFTDMHEAVRSRFQSENQLVGRFLQACREAGVSRAGALGHRLDELETHHREREQALQ
jgi:hypothetical protein